jgi:hypothetical protein
LNYSLLRGTIMKSLMKFFEASCIRSCPFPGDGHSESTALAIARYGHCTDWMQVWATRLDFFVKVDVSKSSILSSRSPAHPWTTATVPARTYP